MPDSHPDKEHFLHWDETWREHVMIYKGVRGGGGGGGGGREDDGVVEEHIATYATLAFIQVQVLQ